MRDKDKVFGGILLVSGTAIGAGMLALPLSTAKLGFFLSGIIFLVCWFFMTLAALLLLEVNLRFSSDNDLISMTGLTLGVFGKTITWILYLLFLYALIIAYLTGSSAWVLNLFKKFDISISASVVMISIMLAFGFIVFYGTVVVERINRYLVYGLILSYVTLIMIAAPSVESTNLNTAMNFTGLSLILPLVITAFGFSPIIPSLTHYLKRNVLSLRYVIIVGSLIPLVIYLLWEWIALGIIPLLGANSFEVLIQHHDDGTGVALALERMTGNLWITQSSRWFSLFAIVTSLLGISLSLFHFLADGFNIRKKTISQRCFLLGCMYIPPLWIVLVYPASFSHVLSFAGLLAAVLFGIVPALMAWRLRYSGIKKFERGSYQMFGGKPVLIAVILFFCYIAYVEIVNCLICRS